VYLDKSPKPSPKLGGNGNWILGCGTIYFTRSNTQVANIKHLYWTELKCTSDIFFDGALLLIAIYTTKVCVENNCWSHVTHGRGDNCVSAVTQATVIHSLVYQFYPLSM